MKQFIILGLLLCLVACGKKVSDSSASIEDRDALNVPVLLDINGNAVTQLVFDTPLNPTYDTFYEMEVYIRNNGTGAGMTTAYIEGGFGDVANFEITSDDPKCRFEDYLGVGEVCTMKVTFRYVAGATPDGVKTARIVLMNADEEAGTVTVHGEVQTL